MSIATIRTALCTQAETVNAISGLGKIRTNEYRADSFNPPEWMILNYRLEYDEAYDRGTDKLTFDTAMAVARADERSAIAALDAYVTALKTALQADQSLGGAAYGVRVSTMPGYVPLTPGNDNEFHLAAPLTVEVYASSV